MSSLKSLRAFLGLASYYRKFIPEFAHLTAPLVMLLKKNARWKWEEEQKRAVRSLVGLLSSAPILAHFDESLPTEIHTDASHLGLGAVLAQKADGEVKPVAFLSRSLSEAEAKYHSNELECLALVWARTEREPRGQADRQRTAVPDFVRRISVPRQSGDRSGSFLLCRSTRLWQSPGSLEIPHA